MQVDSSKSNKENEISLEDTQDKIAIESSLERLRLNKYATSNNGYLIKDIQRVDNAELEKTYKYKLLNNFNLKFDSIYLK
jgi:hypothetical protein